MMMTLPTFATKSSKATLTSCAFHLFTFTGAFSNKYQNYGQSIFKPRRLAREDGLAMSMKDKGKWKLYFLLS
jgi:hypothetical protein